MAQDKHTLLDNWLQQIGFLHGNPFANTEAEREQMLPQYFVDVGYYNLIKGDPDRPQTTLVFAPRGGGKTAHRVMLMTECRPRRRQADILAVLYTDFDPVIVSCGGDLSQVTVQAHLRQILRYGTAALLGVLCTDPDLASAFPQAQRSRLQWFCQTHYPDLLSPSSIQGHLRSVDASFAPEWTVLQRALREHRLGDFLSGRDLFRHPVGQLLVDLVDGLPDPLDERVPVAEQFEAFVSLVQTTGLQAVYVILDRLDEMFETARGGAEAVADLLEPLLAHLPLMQTPGAAFKVFLPLEVRDTLLKRPSIRRDRLLVCEIVWNDNLLRELMEQRLLTYSAGKHRTLAPLCAAPLDGKIETEMMLYADGSPRRLLRLGELLFGTHCSSSEVVLRLRPEEWNQALAVFRREYIPQLRLDQDRQLLLVGNRRVELTGLEYRFLLSLFDGKGWCEKEKLAMQVWNAQAGVSDQAIGQLVRRLREKIEPDPSEPMYLITEWGKGFRLKHIVEKP